MPPPEHIERIARAIAHESKCVLSVNGAWMCKEMECRCRQAARAAYRAALTVIMEPSEGAVKAAQEAYASHDQTGHLRTSPPSTQCVVAMLQAAVRQLIKEADDA